MKEESFYLEDGKLLNRESGAIVGSIEPSGHEFEARWFHPWGRENRVSFATEDEAVEAMLVRGAA